MAKDLPWVTKRRPFEDSAITFKRRLSPTQQVWFFCNFVENKLSYLFLLLLLILLHLNLLDLHQIRKFDFRLGFNLLLFLLDFLASSLSLTQASSENVRLYFLHQLCLDGRKKSPTILMNPIGFFQYLLTFDQLFKLQIFFGSYLTFFTLFLALLQRRSSSFFSLFDSYRLIHGRPASCFTFGLQRNLSLLQLRLHKAFYQHEVGLIFALLLVVPIIFDLSRNRGKDGGGFAQSFENLQSFFDASFHYPQQENYLVYIQIRKMFLHQALPKDAPVFRKPTYQIRRKFSPKNRQLAAKQVDLSLKNAAESAGSSLSKAEHHQKMRIHLICSKDKPNLSSAEKKRKSPIPKHISSVYIKNSILRTQNLPQEVNDVNQNTTPFLERQALEREALNYQLQSTIILCKIQNKATKTVTCSLLYSDLSTIDEAYYLIYQGQTKGNRIRHGFGVQSYTNGEKFVGIFSENKANGQGTYYSLKKKIMGNWQNDRLKEVILQL